MKVLVVTGLLAILAPAAQSAVVQQQYSAYVTSVVSSTGTASIGALPVHVGDQLTGLFSYDNAMTGEPAPWFSPLPYEYGYRGTVQDNHVTLSLNGTEVVASPSATASSCSAFDLLCSSLPVVMARYAGPVLVGSPTDRLSMHYAIPAASPGGLWTMGGDVVKVSSIDLDFFYGGKLSGSALPGQINFSDLRVGQVTLNLSNGAGVLARFDSISTPAVPEPQTWALMVVGLCVMGAVRQSRSGRA